MRPSLRRPLVAVFTAIAALAAAATVVIVTNTAQAADPRDSFVTRCGIRFCIDGKPTYLAGTNTYDLFTYGYDWLPSEQYVDKARALEAGFDFHFVKPLNINELVGCLKIIPRR